MSEKTNAIRIRNNAYVRGKKNSREMTDKEEGATRKATRLSSAVTMSSTPHNRQDHGNIHVYVCLLAIL